MNETMTSCPYKILEIFVYSQWDIQWFLNGFCTIIVALIGLGFNLYSIIMIKCQFKIRKTVKIFLVALSCCDGAVCLSSLAFYALSEAIQPFLGTPQFTQYVTKTFYPISNISMTASVWMLVMITGERYRAIENPFSHRVRDTERRAKIICYSVIVCAGLYCTSTFFELEVKTCLNNSTGKILAYAWATSMRQNKSYLLIYCALLNAVFITIGPFMVISCLSLRMSILANRAKRRRQSLRRSSSQCDHHEHTTLMLLAVTAKFLISNVMMILLNTWEAVYPEMNNSMAFVISVDISNFLVVLNSATNFLVYCRWRKTLSVRRKSTPNLLLANLRKRGITTESFAMKFKKLKRKGLATDRPHVLDDYGSTVSNSMCEAKMNKL